MGGFKGPAFAFREASHAMRPPRYGRAMVRPRHDAAAPAGPDAAGIAGSPPRR